MTRIDGTGPMQIPEMQRPNSTRPRQAKAVREEEVVGDAKGRADTDDTAGLHDATNLRQAVEKLVQSGDLDASADGRVREGRIALARQKTANGAYTDRGVLADIVDRLLQQWQI